MLKKQKTHASAIFFLSHLLWCCVFEYLSSKPLGTASTFSVSKLIRSVVSDYLWPHGLQPARLLCPWSFPGKNTGVGCHFLFQGSSWSKDQAHWEALSGGSVVKNLAASAGDIGSIPGSERAPEGGNGKPLQCSRLRNPMDRGTYTLWGLKRVSYD